LHAPLRNGHSSLGWAPQRAKWSAHWRPHAGLRPRGTASHAPTPSAWAHSHSKAPLKAHCSLLSAGHLHKQASPFARNNNNNKEIMTMVFLAPNVNGPKWVENLIKTNGPSLFRPSTGRWVRREARLARKGPPVDPFEKGSIRRNLNFKSNGSETAVGQ